MLFIFKLWRLAGREHAYLSPTVLLECGKILLVECEILGFEIWNWAQGIWNPESKFHCWRLESGTYS